MAAPRYGRGEDFYCRYEGENNQRPLGESRAGKESSKLTMARRQDVAIGMVLWEGGGLGGVRAKVNKRRDRRGRQEREPRS